ncbi:MAG: hypothetical protein ACRDMZ_01365 [Solirubrobacteraceae bacterium]
MHTEAVALSLVAFAVAVTLGVQARRSLEPARAELAKIGAASGEISSFRDAFKAATPEQDLRVARLADSIELAVPRDRRVAVAQQIAARAEALGLQDVRVRFVAPDSAAAPTRPDLSRTSVAVADYSVAVECTGGLAAVLSLVSELPPSVALQRLVGEEAGGRTRYRLNLAVFEAVSAPAVGMAGTEAVPHG